MNTKANSRAAKAAGGPAASKAGRNTPSASAGTTPDGSLKLWVVLARAYAAMARQVETDISRHGLTPTEFGILEVLHHKGPLLLGEIQRKVLVTSGGTTYLVDRLVAKGLVERQDCPEDRRARYAVLTPTGEALIRRIFPAHANMIERAVGALTPDEQAVATSLLRRLGRGAADLTQE